MLNFHLQRRFSRDFQKKKLFSLFFSPEKIFWRFRPLDRCESLFRNFWRQQIFDFCPWKKVMEISKIVFLKNRIRPTTESKIHMITKFLRLSKCAHRVQLDENPIYIKFWTSETKKSRSFFIFLSRGPNRTKKSPGG